MNEYLSDKLKAISFVLMIMVVFLHSYNLEIKLNSQIIAVDQGINSFIQNFICKGITTIAVPLFFLISGYLFFLSVKNNFLPEFKKKVGNRVKTLAVPYILWSGYGLLLIFALQTIPISRPFFYNELVIDYSLSKLFSTIFIHPIPYQLWFIRDLMILVVLTPIWYKLLKNLKLYVLALFLITWFIEFDYVFFSHEALFFFITGSYLGLNKINPQHLNLKKRSITLLVLWLFLTFIETSLMYFNYNHEWLIIAVHKIEILVGITALWSIYDFYFEDKTRDITRIKAYFLFQFSFFLYVSHEPLLSIYRKALNYVLGHSELESFLVFLLAPLITICTSIVLGFYIKKILPKFYFVISGGR